MKLPPLSVVFGWGRANQRSWFWEGAGRAQPHPLDPPPHLIERKWRGGKKRPPPFAIFKWGRVGEGVRVSYGNVVRNRITGRYIR